MTDEERELLIDRLFVRDAAENLLIAIGMGWDLDGCVENLRAALAQSDAEPVTQSVQPVPPGIPRKFWYRNYRGEVSERMAIMLDVHWGSNEYHKEPQWLVRAYDLDKTAEREFAIKDMAPTRELLTQSNAESVAWTELVYVENFLRYNLRENSKANIVAKAHKALTVAPPRPDASAGLIEAAEWLEKQTTDTYIGTPDFQKGKIYGISLAIDRLRARAADRSGK